VLAEDPFDGDGVGLNGVEHEFEGPLDPEQAVREIGVGGRADDLDVHERETAPRRAVDHADTAAGQARVDSEHAHAVDPSAVPNRCSDANRRSTGLRANTPTASPRGGLA
jgi:hypothetical protein